MIEFYGVGAPAIGIETRKGRDSACIGSVRRTRLPPEGIAQDAVPNLHPRLSLSRARE